MKFHYYATHYHYQVLFTVYITRSILHYIYLYITIIVTLFTY